MSVKSLALLLPLSALFSHTVAVADSTRLYRCEGEYGQVEFRQTPCIEGRQQEVEVENVLMGWDAPAVKVDVKKRKSAGKTRKVGNKSAKNDERCFKMRQRLDTLNRKLRRGYKAGQGADLKHRRRQYEEYLGRYCG